jgi:hypothetical protein
MESGSKRSELTAQIAALRKQQYEASVHATFVGWTPETIEEHDRVSDRIAVLFAQLANASGD